MNVKGVVITAVMAAGLVMGTLNDSQAWPRFMGGRGRADINRDGHVDPVEVKKAAKVNTPLEAKIDKDNDGVVEPVEAQKAAVVAKSKVNRPWEGQADANHDGRVSAVELRGYRLGVLDLNHDGKIDGVERKKYWAAQKYVVNTPLEKKYDANGDGFLTGDEAVEFLKDRARVVSTEGRAVVSSKIEADFDADNDGIISTDEAQAMKDAVGL